MNGRWMGAFAIAFGVLHVAMAFRLRRVGGSAQFQPAAA
jgi:hypothetical protein